MVSSYPASFRRIHLGHMNNFWLDERSQHFDLPLADGNRVTETEDVTLNIPSGDSSGMDNTGTTTLCTTLPAQPRDMRSHL